MTKGNVLSMFSDQGNVWHQISREPLNDSLWMKLLMAYSKQGMPWQTSYVVRQLARLKACGQSAIWSLIDETELPADENFDVVLTSPSAEGKTLLIEKYQNWLQANPDDWLAWVFLCRLLDFSPNGLGLHITAFNNAQRMEYLLGESAHLCGLWRLKSGDVQGAIEMLRSLVDIRPVRHGSMIYLGEALFRIGNFKAAEVAFTRASLSGNISTLKILSDVLFRNNYWVEAMGVLEKALSMDNSNVNLWLDLARIQSQTYQVKKCEESLAKIEQLNPGNFEVALLKTRLNSYLGDAKSYLQNLLMHFEGNQDKNSRLVSSILMTSLYCEDLDAESIANLHRTYAVKLEEVNLSKYKFIKKTNTKRTLKVGYVTGDLYRQHPVNIFMLPLLQQLKTSSIESVIYYTGSMYDSYTSQARECVGDWVEAASLDDDALHQKIIDDEIDILIDLAGHTSTHRLGVFIKRSAPVQVTFLGYPHSTGLSCMDYIIGDHVVTPKEHDFLFSEKIARLNGPVFCWSPVDNYPLPSYVGKTGPVIFGSFNNLLKLSPRTIELWSSILQSVPESKLLLKAPGFVSPEISNHFKNLFGKHSISDHRLIFREPSELGAMMQEYGEIDIALDPLPYNGGTTTLQALWMGVPLITLPGENFASRMGASFLSVLQRTDWIASDHASYVQIAVRMAQSIDKIRGDRFNIRAEMQRSLLCDIKTYSREFERTLHEIAKK